MERGEHRSPWTHGQTNDSADVPASSDVQVPGQKRGQVCASGDGVGGDIGAQLRQGKGGSNDEDAKSSGTVGGFARVGIDEEVGEEVEGVPDGLVKDDGRRRGDDNPDERSHSKANGNREELRPESISGLSGETGEIGVVDD